MITLDQLVKIMPYARNRAQAWVEPLNKAMAEFGIDTPIKQASFLAQVAHESGELHFTLEIASGEAYEGRTDLGNKVKGDGVKYKGRGLIQITGKANYVAVAMALDVDCLVHPEVLETPEGAARSAAWWWREHKLNELAASDEGSFLRVSKVINGVNKTTGLPNGWEDRLAHFKVAKKVLGV